MSNGAVMSPQSNHADNNNDAKKVTTFCLKKFLISFFKDCRSSNAADVKVGDGGEI